MEKATIRKCKYWCIKERHNPQFYKPYYVALGNIPMSEIRRWERPLYGHNVILKFESEAEYEKKKAELDLK